MHRFRTWLCPAVLIASTTIIFAQDSPLPQQGVPPLPHPEIPPPSEVIEPHSPWKMIALATVSTLLLGAVIWLLVKNMKRGVKPPPPPLEKAHRKLRELLRICGTLPPDETGHRVSVIIREYQEARYAVPAPRRTREEIYEKPTTPDEKAKLANFSPLALTCDQIEFAPRPATVADAETLVKSAVEALRRETYPSAEPGVAETAVAS